MQKIAEKNRSFGIESWKKCDFQHRIKENKILGVELLKNTAFNQRITEKIPANFGKGSQIKSEELQKINSTFGKDKKYTFQ